jgi:hypothetical protein
VSWDTPGSYAVFAWATALLIAKAKRTCPKRLQWKKALSRVLGSSMQLIETLETLLGDWRKLLSEWPTSGQITAAAKDALQPNTQ